MSESNSGSVDLNVRRYIMVSVSIAVAALIVVGISLLNLGNFRLNIALSLVVIGVQAVLVLGFMMHLFSERKLIYAVLGFTGFFLIFLMLLTIWSVSEVPHTPGRVTSTTAEAAR
jgi:hypothetical protein